jgi:hypothetical protein
VVIRRDGVGLGECWSAWRAALKWWRGRAGRHGHMGLDVLTDGGRTVVLMLRRHRLRRHSIPAWILHIIRIYILLLANKPSVIEYFFRLEIRT